MNGRAPSAGERSEDENGQETTGGARGRPLGNAPSGVKLVESTGAAANAIVTV